MPLTLGLALFFQNIRYGAAVFNTSRKFMALTFLVSSKMYHWLSRCA